MADQKDEEADCLIVLDSQEVFASHLNFKCIYLVKFNYLVI